MQKAIRTGKNYSYASQTKSTLDIFSQITLTQKSAGGTISTKQFTCPD
jgi:hypothetical protein